MRVIPSNILKIDALIPQAVKYADDQIEANIGQFSWEWSKIFLDRMDELTIAAGLRVDLSQYADHICAEKEQEKHKNLSFAEILKAQDPERLAQMTVKEIADEFGMHDNTTWNTLKRIGVKFKKVRRIGK